MFEGTCFLPARRICLGAFSRASGDTNALPPVSRRGEILDALLRTHHNGLTCKSRQRSTDLTRHEEKDRDAQDRASRASAVATRRPAQTSSRPERPEDRAARRGMNYDELIACRRRHLNTHYNGKRGKGDAFDHAKGKINAADVLLDSRVERIVLASYFFTQPPRAGRLAALCC